ncbi:MAG: hypothetical protein Edafosvirus6_16 [Edafosvirus sp.]|uniref:Uncharacterized protein n=1 Tax=Edafosvirus sp. TaxID=2487765 RepID=A0A3G4ZTF8_9VIRU|nr:MAG: hypothetical protein Edafosvirus6_16 [Edafosvirus sp.]
MSNSQFFHIFDFDGVLFDFRKTWKLFPNTIQILKNLKQKGYRIALASKRQANSSFSEQILNVLRENNIHDLFDGIYIADQTKVTHILTMQNNLEKKYGTSLKPILYDDDEQNIKECSSAGYITVHINTHEGIKESDIIKEDS